GHEVGDLIELLSLQLRAFLPLDHPAQARQPAVIGRRAGILEQPANPGARPEVLQVRGGRLAAPSHSVAQGMATQALLLEHGKPLSQWVAAHQEPGPLGGDANLRARREEEGARLGLVGLLPRKLELRVASVGLDRFEREVSRGPYHSEEERAGQKMEG